ncbi:unnamed protein product [Urochloa humidicola]
MLRGVRRGARWPTGPAAAVGARLAHQVPRGGRGDVPLLLPSLEPSTPGSPTSSSPDLRLGESEQWWMCARYSLMVRENNFFQIELVANIL